MGKVGTANTFGRRSLGGLWTRVEGVGTDVHNLKPADGGLNSLRSNHEYDDLGTTGSGVNYNGSATGNRINGSAGLFEPRDKVKGDLARIILYMDLRYEGAGTEPDLVVREALNSGGTTHAVLSTLIDWHWADPVDSFEMNRNECDSYHARATAIHLLIIRNWFITSTAIQRTLLGIHSWP